MNLLYIFIWVPSLLISLRDNLTWFIKQELRKQKNELFSMPYSTIFIFQQDTKSKRQKHTHTYIHQNNVNIYNTQHKREDPITRQYRTPRSAAITTAVVTRYLFLCIYTLKRRPSHSLTQDFLPFATPKRQLFSVYH